MHQYIDKAHVVATSAVTYIATAVTVLQFVLTQDAVADIPIAVQYITQAISILAGAILVIRRVTPVPPAERGLLPVE